MNPLIYVSMIAIWVVVFMMILRRKNAIIRKMIKKRKLGGRIEMKALAERFIGKDCVIYSFDSSRQFSGVIKEVTDGAILVEKDGKLEAINLDFVIRIREYPLNKKGKKASIIMD